jgi:predicted transcriptional regulator
MTKEQISAVSESVRRTGVYVMTEEEQAAVREGLEQARRGEFVLDEEVDAFWKKIGVL